MINKKLRAISGSIGVGKSTLLSLISLTIDNVVAVEEPVNHELLKKFYNNMEEYAFLYEHYVLKDFTHLLKQKLDSLFGTDILVFDRIPHEVLVFEKILYDLDYITDKEHEAFLWLSRELLSSMPLPSHMVYLDASEDVLLQRQSLRARAGENKIEKSYLTRLKMQYISFLGSLKEKGVEVTILDWSKFGDVKEVLLFLGF